MGRPRANGQPAKRKFPAAPAHPDPDPPDWTRDVERVQEEHVQGLLRSHAPWAVHALLEIATDKRLTQELDADGRFKIELSEDGKAIQLGYGAGPRATAARAILEQYAGRPVPQVQRGIAAQGSGLTIVINELRSGKQREIDVTGNTLEIGPGAD